MPCVCESVRVTSQITWVGMCLLPCRGVFRGGARGARAPPSASSPVLINSILGTTGSTAGLFNGCSTSVLSNPACISYLLTYYVLESRHRRDRDRHRQPLILNWVGHPTSTTPTNNNNHVELAHAQLVGEVAKKKVNTYNNCA